MTKEQFASDSLREIFTDHQLGSFEALWTLELPWFEAPNHRRNGWSGVVTHTLQQADGQPLNLFIKRQQNHNTKSVRHPIDGEPTFHREFRNIKRLRVCQIPSLEALYYGERKIGDEHQAILITRALDGYLPIQEFYPSCQNDPSALLQAIAKLVIKLHAASLAHYCLYPCHIFATRDAQGEIKLRLIDLEKLRRSFSPAWRIKKDFGTFIRRSGFMGRSSMVKLLDAYTELSPHITTGDKTYQKLIHKIDQQNYS